MPLGLGLDVSTGTSTPPTSSANSSIQSFTIFGYLSRSEQRDRRQHIGQRNADIPVVSEAHGYLILWL